jgi:hypothetical protein
MSSWPQLVYKTLPDGGLEIHGVSYETIQAALQLADNAVKHRAAVRTLQDLASPESEAVAGADVHPNAKRKAQRDLSETSAVLRSSVDWYVMTKRRAAGVRVNEVPPDNVD